MLKLRLSVLALAGLSVLSSACAVTITEDFSADPAARGWQVFGDTNLFRWNSGDQNLEVTWNSSQTNSYFYYPLGNVLGREDDFSLAFDLRLTDITVGFNPAKPYAFELAIGFLNLTNATQTNFWRGTGMDSPSLVEFDYFGDAGYGATVWPQFVSTNSVFNYNGASDYTIVELTPGDWFHILITYTGSNHTLATTMTRGGEPFGPIHAVVLSPGFTDFRVDTVSVSSYSDTGDDWDSLLAHGTLDNIVVTTSLQPIGRISGGCFPDGHWQAQFLSHTNWLYTLERTTDFQSWLPVSATLRGADGILCLQDTNTLPAKAFYRVRAD